MMPSSSRKLKLLFLRPKTAWVVSGFRTLLTTGVEEKRTQVSLFSKTKASSSGSRPTNDGLQDRRRAFDELVVNLVDQVAQDLLILRQIEMGETLLILLRGVVFSDGLQRNGITRGPFRSSAPLPARLASNPQPLYLIAAVLLQTVPQSARVGQPEGHRLKLVSSPLKEKMANSQAFLRLPPSVTVHASP